MIASRCVALKASGNVIRPPPGSRATGDGCFDRRVVQHWSGRHRYSEGRTGRLDRAVERWGDGNRGLPPTLGLRLGGHFGPVFPVYDPVLKQMAYMGRHVSRTARIEPVTPEGMVYVTDACAAALSLSRQSRNQTG